MKLLSEFPAGSLVFFEDEITRKPNTLTAFRVTRTGVTNCVTRNRLTFKRFPGLYACKAISAGQ